jgi:hypothetical protein
MSSHTINRLDKFITGCSNTTGGTMRQTILNALDTFLEMAETIRTGRKTPTEVLTSMLAGVIILVLFIFVFLKAHWFFAFAAWWACSELTKIRITMQEEITLRRASHGKD